MPFCVIDDESVKQLRRGDFLISAWMLLRARWLRGQSDSPSHKLGINSSLVLPFEQKEGRLCLFDKTNRTFLKPKDFYYQPQSLSLQLNQLPAVCQASGRPWQKTSKVSFFIFQMLEMVTNDNSSDGNSNITITNDCKILTLCQALVLSISHI